SYPLVAPSAHPTGGLPGLRSSGSGPRGGSIKALGPAQAHVCVEPPPSPSRCAVSSAHGPTHIPDRGGPRAPRTCHRRAMNARTGSSSVATVRMARPHWAHRVGSAPKVYSIKARHATQRPAGRETASSGGWGTTRRRSGDAGANTPKYRTRFTPGGSSSRLASLSTNTSGRSRTPVCPLRQGCLNRMHAVQRGGVQSGGPLPPEGPV
ncbi:MAG: hypothetical protein ACI8PZ_007200, partial [Myxococcota bacterium]